MLVIGFAGLGHMGLPMARSLLEAGHDLRVYNRNPERVVEIQSMGARPAATPGEVANEAQIVVSMVSDDEALRATTLGADGILQHLPAGGIHVSMSTVSPEIARELATAHTQRGSAYVAAPVFGRPAAAESRKLWIVVSGPSDAKRRARPVLENLGQGIFDFGDDPGAANVVKLAGNFLISAATESLAETLALAEKNGIPRAQLAEMMSRTLFDCPIYRTYGDLVARQVFSTVGFKLSLGLKDMSLARDLATASRVPMPILDLVLRRMLSGIAKGRADMDVAALALGASEDAALEP
jgi:3-hydroxyisobutyrate dehydrogenase-like beta-hydroxyacid dehydrogenase